MSGVKNTLEKQLQQQMNSNSKEDQVQMIKEETPMKQQPGISRLQIRIMDKNIEVNQNRIKQIQSQLKETFDLFDDRITNLRKEQANFFEKDYKHSISSLREHIYNIHETVKWMSKQTDEPILLESLKSIKPILNSVMDCQSDFQRLLEGYQQQTKAAQTFLIRSQSQQEIIRDLEFAKKTLEQKLQLLLSLHPVDIDEEYQHFLKLQMDRNVQLLEDIRSYITANEISEKSNDVSVQSNVQPAFLRFLQKITSNNVSCSMHDFLHEANKLFFNQQKVRQFASVSSSTSRAAIKIQQKEQHLVNLSRRVVGQEIETPASSSRPITDSQRINGSIYKEKGSGVRQSLKSFSCRLKNDDSDVDKSRSKSIDHSHSVQFKFNQEVVENQVSQLKQFQTLQKHRGTSSGETVFTFAEQIQLPTIKQIANERVSKLIGDLKSIQYPEVDFGQSPIQSESYRKNMRNNSLLKESREVTERVNNSLSSSIFKPSLAKPTERFFAWEKNLLRKQPNPSEQLRYSSPSGMKQKHRVKRQHVSYVEYPQIEQFE